MTIPITITVSTGLFKKQKLLAFIYYIWMVLGVIIIRNKEGDMKLEALLALLNSGVISFYIRDSYSATGIDGGVNFTAPMIGDIPMPEFNEKEINLLEGLANKIIQITYSDDYFDNPEKQARVKTLEKEIDKLVYELYYLTPEEIAIVENFNKVK